MLILKIYISQLYLFKSPRGDHALYLYDANRLVDNSGRLRGIKYADWDGCGIGCGSNYYFEVERGYDADWVPERLWLFQDNDRKCLLYSYTKEELLALKNKAGFSMADKGAVFLLEKTGIRVIS